MKKLEFDFRGLDISMEEALNNHADQIHNQIILAITEALETNESIAHIADIQLDGDAVYVVQQRDVQWLTSLSSTLDYYTREEEYEKCRECKNLMLKVDNMLKNRKVV